MEGFGLRLLGTRLKCFSPADSAMTLPGGSRDHVEVSPSAVEPKSLLLEQVLSADREKVKKTM